jgi:twitching motility protein PilI
MNQEYFTLELASEINLGLPLADMGSVIQLETINICTVPGVANFWHGVINFKGSLLWILDSDRFLMRSLMGDSSPKLTAVILQSQQTGSQNKVALVTQKLKGIISVESSCLQPLPDNLVPQLGKCCSAIAQNEGQQTYIIDSVALLQQLHQQSSLALV